MLPRMRYAVYPLTLLVLVAVSGVREAPLLASPVQDRLTPAQFNRQGRGRRRNPERMRRNQEERFERLCTYLELTGEQKKQAREYFDTRNKNTMELFQAARSGELEREAARDSMAVLMNAYLDQIKSLLTGEQKARLEEWMKQRRNRRSHRPGGAGLEDLTPEQREQLAGLRNGHKQSLFELREKLRSGELERSEFKELLEQESSLFKSSLGEILTGEQLEKILAGQTVKGRARGRQAGRLGLMKHLPRLKEALGLSEDQVESIKRLAGAYRKQAAEIIRTGREEELERPEIRKKLAALTRRVRSAVADLLTPGQNEQLSEILAKLKQTSKPRVPLIGLPGKLGRRLGLDENQLAEIRALAEPYREAVVGILRTARQEELSRVEVRQKIEPLVSRFREAVRSILTEEQNELLDRLLAERRKNAPAGPGQENDDSSAELSGNTSELPTEFELAQNSPNPFNPSTTIFYSVPVSDLAVPVNITVYDVRGKPVVELVNKFHQPGNYSVVFDGRDGQGRPATSGVYFYKLKAGDYTETRKMVLLK